MIKKLLFVGIAVCCLSVFDAVAAYLPENDKDTEVAKGTSGKEKYSRYFNISYVSQKFKYVDSDYSIKSDYGAALTRGRTYFVHRKPIAGMIRFGIDWTTFDLNFAGYSSDEYYDKDEKEMVTDKMYQLEAAMHVGPSVTVNPVSDLRVNGYFRYAPSFTGFYDSEDFYCNYGSFFVAGAAISYKVISLGIESRWGKSKFKEDYEDYKGNTVSEKVNVKTSGARFYLSFRF